MFADSSSSLSSRVFDSVWSCCFILSSRGRDYDVRRLPRTLPGHESPDRLGPVDASLLPRGSEGRTEARRFDQQALGGISVSVNIQEPGPKLAPSGLPCTVA